MRIITKTIWILSLVSLFTDVASEMLYPVMPVFLKSIGFSIIAIGILEGFAEAIAGLSKAWFGNMSDKVGRRLPFVQLGYGLSAISKPMMAAFVFPLWIFTARALDRLGKGIRTGARDALLSDESTSATKARVFGFHRSLDSFGAVLGPAIALAWLYYRPGDYRNLFLLAFIPGILAIAATFILKEKKPERTRLKSLRPTSFFVFIQYWKTSPELYKKLVAGLVIFALVNSSDVFLLLKVKSAGVSDPVIIGIYIFYNLIYSVAAYPMGILADKLGMKKVLLIGLSLFVAIYASFAVFTSLWHFIALFACYGVYAAATEGISKAWISNIVSKSETATAIGTFTGFQSIASFVASSVAGLIWFRFGATCTFIFTAVISFFAAAYIYRFCKDPITPNC
ncbi:MAG: MFS transporter [Chitinophagaceae bacterium]